MIFKIKQIWIKRLIILIASFFSLIMVFWIAVYSGLWGKLPNKEQLKDIKQSEASLVLDSHNKLLGKFFIFDRQVVAYEDLPQDLIHALVATEDVRFYEHAGVDYRSFFRVFVKSLLLQDASGGGGSTISQQLVKNLYGRENHGIFSLPVSKVKEMIIAKRIEKVYSKQDILTLYFNTVPFSDNTFGIESAAQKFYNTSANNLNLSQCATLVGTLKASHSFNPRLFPERSQLRRDVVLQQMEKYGFISEMIKNGANSNQLKIEYRQFDHDVGIAPYFRELIRKEIVKVLDTIKKSDGSKFDIYKDGLRIHTTLDNTLQEYAEVSMKNHMGHIQNEFEKAFGKNKPWESKDYVQRVLEGNSSYKSLKAMKVEESKIWDTLSIKRQQNLFSWDGDSIQMASLIDSIKHYNRFLNTGFIAIEPQTGAIRSYVGGIDYENFKFDHVSMGKRQVGSTFKPFVYTAAIENGMHPCTYFPVQAVTYMDKNDWTPTNSSEIEDEEHLNYSLEKALSNSVNTIAVKVLKATQIEPVRRLAKKLGITSEIPKVPSIALGTAELSLLELATAYTGYANNGVAPDPYFITKIEDKNGNLIYEYKPKRVRPAFSKFTNEVMIEMMKATVNTGTATRLRNTYKLPNDIAGKTGTTQNNKDGWFVGISPNLVMAAWVGHDDHRIGFANTRIGQGANSALPMVALFLQKVNNDPHFSSISQAKFKTPSIEVRDALDCDPEFKEGFLGRLFSSDKTDRNFKKSRDFKRERAARKARYRKKRN